MPKAYRKKKKLVPFPVSHKQIKSTTPSSSKISKSTTPSSRKIKSAIPEIKTVHQTFGWWKHGGLGVAEHETKGRYLLATSPIQAGRLILTERPVYVGKDHEEVAKQMVNDPRFLHLYPLVPSVSPTPRILDMEHAMKIVDGNSWGITTPDDQQLTAMYLHMSMINHSCVPNTCFMQNSLYSLRDILIGEEVTCSYLLPAKLGNLSAEERRKRMSNWFPECRCVACVSKIQFSLEEIEKLHNWSEGCVPNFSKDRNLEFWALSCLRHKASKD